MEIKENKLRIWGAVEETDPNHVKSFNRGGGFKGSAVNTAYQLRRATELWGPAGIGWGYTIHEERYTEGHWIDEQNRMLIHIIRLSIWYIGDDGECHETPHQFGQTTFVGKNKNGVYTDEEAPKKSVTDAILKCLSLLGFSADIFMGRYDDNKYVNDLRDKYSQPPKSQRENLITDLHRAGKARYGDDWKAQGPDLLEEVTGKRSTDDLDRADLVRVIRRLEDRAPDAPGDADLFPEAKETD